MADELEKIEISNGEISSGEIYGYGDNITVKSGATLDDAYIPSSAGSLTLEAGAILTDTITIGVNTTVEGIVDADEANLNLDISDRKEEDGVLISDWENISSANSISITVDSNQDKGTYILAANAAEFDKTITIKSDSELELGTISVSNPQLDYSMTRYNLAINDDGQLVLTVSSNISDTSDYIFLYKDGELVATAKSVDGIEISEKGMYDEMIVLNGGIATNCTITSGIINVQDGGIVTDLEQNGGALRFDYTEGSDTIITGTNSAGELFFVSNNEIKNVRAEKVSVSGNVLITDSHFSGDLSTSGSVTITGDIFLGGMFNFQSGTTITSASLIASNSRHEYSIWGEGVLVENSSLTFNGGAYVEMVSGIEVNNSFIYGNTLIYLRGGEYSNVTVDATPYFSVRGTITLNDTFYIEDNTCSDWLAGAIDANGQTIVVDYTERSVLDDALLMVNKIRNAEIVININSDQVLGTYAIAVNASNIGQGDEKGVWDADTNTWKYQGAVYGDLDGIIELRDENGIAIANCTVNGDTEYAGRYNYTVNVDANGNMNLTIGINSREGLAFAADGYDNNSFAKATKLTGNVGSLDKLTIDSASDIDYYKFTLDTAGRAASSIGIDYKMWKGDLDLYLYDSKGNLVDYAKSVTDNEVLSLHKLAAGDYYLKVVGYEGNTNEYTICRRFPLCRMQPKAAMTKLTVITWANSGNPFPSMPPFPMPMTKTTSCSSSKKA